MLRLILTDTEMALFLILRWRAAAMGLCGGPNIFPDNSRFSEFNSRLGGFKFPVKREIPGILTYAGRNGLVTGGNGNGTQRQSLLFGPDHRADIGNSRAL